MCGLRGCAWWWARLGLVEWQRVYVYLNDIYGRSGAFLVPLQLCWLDCYAEEHQQQQHLRQVTKREHCIAYTYTHMPWQNWFVLTLGASSLLPQFERLNKTMSIFIHFMRHFLSSDYSSSLIVCTYCIYQRRQCSGDEVCEANDKESSKRRWHRTSYTIYVVTSARVNDLRQYGRGTVWIVLPHSQCMQWGEKKNYSNLFLSHSFSRSLARSLSSHSTLSLSLSTRTYELIYVRAH